MPAERLGHPSHPLLVIDTDALMDELVRRLDLDHQHVYGRIEIEIAEGRALGLWTHHKFKRSELSRFDPLLPLPA